MCVHKKKQMFLGCRKLYFENELQDARAPLAYFAKKGTTGTREGDGSFRASRPHYLNETTKMTGSDDVLTCFKTL